MDPALTLTINDRTVQARPGQTVLQAAVSAGIDIPTLCHHPHLHPEGACRVCLVEIQNQRALQPACTFPVTDGMVVRTETPAVNEARLFSLQMLFSERTHYCMFCPASGDETSTDCELQKLAYRFGLNFWEFIPDYGKHWPLDASRSHFIMDHGRCILCRRCIRACAALPANHTLGVRHRGAKTMICADDDLPFGESSCVSCGSCLQVCPTGALMDRRSAYLGHGSQVTRTRSTCMGCAVGCGIVTITRDNQLLRIEGDWDAANAGLLCRDGRFTPLPSTTPRLRQPLLRHNAQLIPTDWPQALRLIADRLRDTRRVGSILSPRLPDESLAAARTFFTQTLHSTAPAMLYGQVPSVIFKPTATLADIPAADCILVLGADPLRRQPVVGYLIRRALDRDARLLIIHDIPTELDDLTDTRFNLVDLPSALPYLTAAQRPLVLYGPELGDDALTTLRLLPEQTRFLPLSRGANSLGAARLDLDERAIHGDVLFAFLGDDSLDGRPLPPAQFTIVQTAHLNAWTDTADVVLPARLWYERDGHITNLENRSLALHPSIPAPQSIPDESQLLTQLAREMGLALPLEHTLNGDDAHAR